MGFTRSGESGGGKESENGGEEKELLVFSVAHSVRSNPLRVVDNWVPRNSHTIKPHMSVEDNEICMQDLFQRTWLRKSEKAVSLSCRVLLPLHHSLVF